MLFVLIKKSSITDEFFQPLVCFPNRLRRSLLNIFQLYYALIIGLRFSELLLQGILNLLYCRILMLRNVSHEPIQIFPFKVLEILRGGVNQYSFQLEHQLIFNYYQCLYNDSSKQKEHKCTQFLRWKPTSGQKPPNFIIIII